MSTIIANIFTLIANVFSMISPVFKTKRKIVIYETISTIFRLLSTILVKGWTELFGKVIKLIFQFKSLNKKYKKIDFYIGTFIYIVFTIVILCIFKNYIFLIAIFPSIIEFYALLNRSVKKYRMYSIITRILWTINNIVFKLYVGIIFDVIVMIGHYIKLKK